MRQEGSIANYIIFINLKLQGMKKVTLLFLRVKLSKKLAYVVFLCLTSLLLNSRVNANPNQAPITLNFDNVKLIVVLDYIESRTRYRFLYQNDDLDANQIVSINYKGTIQGAMQVLFRNTDIEAIFSVENQIILKKKIKKDKLLTITGTVTCKADGLAVPDVYVLVNQDERGTATDKQGKYTIKAKKGDVISFGFIGFKTIKHTVGNQSTINVSLTEDVNQLDEVVIGYGTLKKENVSTAISSIKGKTVGTNMQSGVSFDRGLDGLIKGVFVTQGTGELGNNADIIIRGVTSPFSGGTHSNNPLYIIDGVPLYVGSLGFNPLETINPEDIESVDVLKDAAATSIYGSRGANGVIIVKTKTGHYGQETTVSISQNTTFGKPIKMLEYLNANEFKNYILALNKNSYDYYLTGVDSKYGEEQLALLNQFGFSTDNSTGKIIYDPSKIEFGNANTNWNIETYRPYALTNQINANISGGGERSFYGLSLGYVNQEGLLRADRKIKYNARLNLQFNVTNKLKVGASVNYTNINTNSGFSNFSNNSENYLGSGVLRFRPDLPVYDKYGNFVYNNSGTIDAPIYASNPVALTTLSNQTNKINNSILSNVFAEYEIIPSLSFKADYSFMVSYDNVKAFLPSEYSLDGYEKGITKSELQLNETNFLNTVINYTLNYNKAFDKHTVTGLLGFSHNNDKLTLNQTVYKDFISNLTDPQFSKTQYMKNRSVSPSGLNSYFARAAYIFDRRYGLSGTLRLDRSSKFAPENRNAFFPSISANWNIHNESFMQNSFIDELKLRASVGKTGSVSVGDFAYLQTYDNSGTENYNGDISIDFSQFIANKKLKWETTIEYNIGLDFRFFFKNAIRASIDFYHKTTSDVVSNDTEIVESGADQFSRNNAKIENKGFELSIGSDIIKTQNFLWSVDINASKNMNKVLELSDEVKNAEVLSRYYVVGREVNVIKGYVVNGIIQNQDRVDELNKMAKSKKHNYYDTKGLAPGDYEYKDINGDGKIDSKDLTIIGTRQPKLFGGVNSRFEYKGISLGLYFSFAYGFESIRRNENNNAGKFLNIERYMAPQYRWSPSNKTAAYPRLVHNSLNPNNRTSTANIFDSSYLRLTAIRLGYDLPLSIIEKIKLKKLNVYVAATNMLTWTNYPGLDPQGAIEGGASPMNIDNYDAYPQSKTFAMGIKIQF